MACPVSARMLRLVVFLAVVVSKCSARPGLGDWGFGLLSRTHQPHPAPAHRALLHWHQHGSLDVTSSLISRTYRRLLQEPLVVPQCFWDEQSQTCDADDAVNIMYAIKSRPASAYLWFLLMTYDRETVCGSYTTSEGCRGDTAHRCIWFDDILDAIGEGSASSTSSSSSSNSTSAGSSAKKPAADTVAGSTAAAAALHFSSSQTALLRQLLPEHIRLERELLHSLAVAEQHTYLQQPFDIAAARAAYMVDASTPAKSSTAGSSSSGGSGSGGSSGSSSSSNTAGKRRGRDVMCTSTDMLENYVFTRSKYSNPLQAPLTMHCPGSRAHELVTCMRITNSDVCRKNPACLVVQPHPDQRNGHPMCVSAYVDSLTQPQMKQFMFELRLAEPSVVGTCDGGCWMRQALLCNRSSDASNCSALSFCRWSSSGSCTPRLYSQDLFGSSVQEYMGECVDVDNKRDCNSLKITLTNKGTYSNWRMPMTPTAQCLVPSISMLLKSSSSDLGGGRPQGPVLAPAGADEERAAELHAAAAAAQAAAAAAKAAVAKSGRGSAAFEHLYLSLAEQLLYV